MIFGIAVCTFNGNGTYHNAPVGVGHTVGNRNGKLIEVVYHASCNSEGSVNGNNNVYNRRRTVGKLKYLTVGICSNIYYQ